MFVWTGKLYSNAPRRTYVPGKWFKNEIYVIYPTGFREISTNFNTFEPNCFKTLGRSIPSLSFFLFIPPLFLNLS